MTLLPYITPKCELFYSRHSLKQVVKSHYASCFPFSCFDTVKLPDASERPANCDDKSHLREPFLSLSFKSGRWPTYDHELTHHEVFIKFDSEEKLLQVSCVRSSNEVDSIFCSSQLSALLLLPHAPPSPPHPSRTPSPTSRHKRERIIVVTFVSIPFIETSNHPLFYSLLPHPTSPP